MLGRRSFSWCVVALSFGSSLVVGQHNRTQSSLPFRSSARLVLLDVTVSDSSDHPVENLSQKDFTVLEDGIPQRIESFERPEAHTMALEHSPGDDLWQAPGETAPVTIFVLDELNTEFKDTTFARNKLGKFLASQSGDLPQPTALIALTQTRLEVLSNYSRDARAVLRELNAHPSSIPWMLMHGGVNGEAERLNTTLNALDQIGSANSDRQRRKNIIWIGSGFRLLARAMLFQQSTRDTATAAVKTTTGRLLRAHATVYTVDPSGLRVDSDGHADVMASDGTIMTAPTDPASGDLTFEALAPATGGKIFRLRNDVSSEISSAVADGTTYYTLSYSPANRNWDGKFRTIRVEVSRPGLRVRTRQGYYATEDPVESVSPDVALAEAVKNPIPYAGMAVKPEIVKLSSNPPSGQVTLGIDRHGLSWNLLEDGRRHAQFTAVRAELSARGEVLEYQAAQKSVFIDKGTEAQFQRSLKVPILFTMSIPVPEKAARIRFVICDTASGRIGTADVELKGTSAKQAQDSGDLKKLP